MLQNMYNSYLRGFNNLPIGVYKVSKLLRLKYKEGLSDFKNNKSNRYLK